MAQDSNDMESRFSNLNVNAMEFVPSFGMPAGDSSPVSADVQEIVPDTPVAAPANEEPSPAAAPPPPAVAPSSLSSSNNNGTCLVLRPFFGLPTRFWTCNMLIFSIKNTIGGAGFALRFS